MAKNIKQKAAVGVLWSAVQKYSTMFIQFISGIILARLLTPYDYGCIGMLNIFMILAENFIDGGFGSALIQKKKPTQEDYSTIFFWNIGMAVVLYAILYFSAPAIARFYEIPLLCSVLRVQALVLFIYAFNIVQKNQLRKKLNFKLLSIITIITSLVALGVTIFMAYKGYGVWALVAQHLITAAIPAIVFWFYVKWRPIWAFSWRSFKELFNFGFFMFLTHLVNSFSLQIRGLLIGKVYSPVTMGYYSKAQGTEKLASQSISSVLTQVTYPLYAQVQDDKDAMVTMIQRITGMLAYIVFPMMFILMLTAKPLFILLYSERWAASVPYFQVLCLAGLAACLQNANLQTIAAIGRSKTMFLWTLVKQGLGLALVVGGLIIWGMKGLLLGSVLHAWLSYFINCGLVSKYIGYKWTRQIKDLLPVVIASVIAAAISYGCGMLCKLDMYWDGILKLLVYLFVYGSWTFLFKPASSKFFFSSIRLLTKKK